MAGESEERKEALCGDLRIMTFEEYAGMRHETPYVFPVDHGNKHILYFGSAHSKNPKDEMFVQIEREFNVANPQKVFVEGMPRLNAENAEKEEVIRMLKEMDRDTVIREYGEPGFTLKLAIEKGDVEIESPEPTVGKVTQSLSGQGYTQEDIFAFYLYRYVNGYFRGPSEVSMDEYLAECINGFKISTNWEDFDYSLEHLKSIGERIWGERGDMLKREYAEDRIDPTPWKEKKDSQTVINEISRASNIYRDQFMVNRIKQEMKELDRIFIVYGYTHAVMQEKAMRNLILR